MHLRSQDRIGWWSFKLFFWDQAAIFTEKNGWKSMVKERMAVDSFWAQEASKTTSKLEERCEERYGDKRSIRWKLDISQKIEVKKRETALFFFLLQLSVSCWRKVRNFKADGADAQKRALWGKYLLIAPKSELNAIFVKYSGV